MAIRFSLLSAAALALLGACSSPSEVGGGCNSGNVCGQIVTLRGEGIPDLTVVIAGQSVTTDSNGRFSVIGVTVPYDVAIVTTTPTNKLVTVYSRLTGNRPKLLDLTGQSWGGNSATISGNVLGVADAGCVLGVSFGSSGVQAGTTVRSLPYNLNLFWSGPVATSGTVHALQWTVDARSLPTGYVGYGTRTDVRVSNGAATSGADVTLASVATTEHVSGIINPPVGGYSIGGRELWLTFSDGAYMELGWDPGSNPLFDFSVPAGIGSSAVIWSTATDGSSVSSAYSQPFTPGTTDATLILPQPAEPVSPSNGTTGVDTTTPFEWSAVPGAIYVFTAGANDWEPSFRVVSGATTAYLPDLTAQGVPLPSSGTEYVWSVLAIGPSAGIDAVAATGSFPQFPVMFETTSASRQFTTR